MYSLSEWNRAVTTCIDFWTAPFVFSQIVIGGMCYAAMEVAAKQMTKHAMTELDRHRK